MKGVAVDESRLAENAIKMGKTDSSATVLLKSMHLFGLKDKCIIRLCLFAVIEISVAVFMSRDVDTINQCETVIGIFHSIIVSVFAIVFTGYALFQALLNKELLIAMLSSSLKNDKNEDTSYIEYSNNTFVEFMMALFSVIVLDLIIRVFLNIIPDSWCMFANNSINEIISCIGIILILYINMEVLWETKSFIYNVYTLFNAYTMTKALEYLRELREREEK